MSDCQFCDPKPNELELPTQLHPGLNVGEIENVEAEQRIIGQMPGARAPAAC